MNQTVTPWTVALMAAYLQYYTPKRLHGRHLSLTDLRCLSSWLDCPRPQVRSLRKHPLVAAHLTLMYALGFLNLEDDMYSLQPALTEWLFLDQRQQICQLLGGLNEERFTNIASTLNLDACLRIDYRIFLQQALRQQLATEPLPSRPAMWQILSGGSQQAEAAKQSWHLLLPPCLAPWLLFDLLQLGELVSQNDTEDPQAWAERSRNRFTENNSEKVLVCTPLTVARAGKRGYGKQVIKCLLEEATQAPLPSNVARQLTTWLKRGRSYQVGTVQLLTTAQDHQLSEILRHRQLKQHIDRQVSPREAIVSSELVPILKRWLAKQQYELETEAFAPTDLGPAAYSWLGLRVLVSLRELMPLPLPAPVTALTQLEGSLAADQRSEMEALARHILSNLHAIIRGQDSFFPAVCSPLPETVARLQKAINEQKPLLIEYQSLGDYRPQFRRIQPYRLEEREPLYYLYAYCYRAEADLTFRVDRICQLIVDSGR